MSRSEEITAVMEAQLVGKKRFDSDREINEFWSDAKMVLRLASYLARTIDYDIHWSKCIVEALFTPAYIKEHIWPAET